MSQKGKKVTVMGVVNSNDACYFFQVNREIIETMVHAYTKIFGNLKPVFDGRNNLYTRDPLPIGNSREELEVTLPGEGKDRLFRVSIKWVAQVGIIITKLETKI